MLAIFVHRRGPGQFVHLIERLAGLGYEIVLICETFDRPVPGAVCLRYDLKTGSSRLSPSLVATDHHVRTGEAVAAVLDRLRAHGCRPSVIVGHTGWGGLTFVKDVFPEAPVLGYCEFYHTTSDSDFDFGAAQPTTLANRARVRMRNAAQLTTLHAIEAGLSPTAWQRGQYPKALQSRIVVCHDGIDTRACRPAETASLTLPDGRVLRSSDRIVTYAARDLEPYRGLPQFLEIAKQVSQRDPDVLFVAVGGDGVSYGSKRTDGRSWREAEMERTGLDPSRIVFPGWLSHADLIRLFQVSSAHVYLTVPFVLSWSMLEAMACGCLLIGSATPPVEEVIENNRNGLLCDFFDTESFAECIGDALARPDAYRPMRAAARHHIRQRFELQDCLDRQTRTIAAMAHA